MSAELYAQVELGMEAQRVLDSDAYRIAVGEFLSQTLRDICSINADEHAEFSRLATQRITLEGVSSRLEGMVSQGLSAQAEIATGERPDSGHKLL